MKKKLISGRQFLLRMLLILLSHFSAFTVLGQGITVSGKITAVSGEALQGVSVSIKDTKTATTTDASGTFTLKGANANSVLVITHVGYLLKELPVGDGSFKTSRQCQTNACVVSDTAS
jgi:hypothetical protein